MNQTLIILQPGYPAISSIARTEGMSVTSSLLWDKVYPLSLRDVTVATVLGLSTLGFFWATQRWVSSLTRYERSLIESFGISNPLLLAYSVLTRNRRVRLYHSTCFLRYHRFTTNSLILHATFPRLETP